MSDSPIRPFPAPIPAIRSHRSAIVARAFGVTIAPKIPDDAQTVFDCDAMRWLDSLLPLPGKIVLITGPSGAGKSSLLRALRNSARHTGAIRWIDLSRICAPDRPIVDCFGKKSLAKVLELLSRVGLAEVWTYLRTPSELSEGQRWRLRLALALARTSTQRNPKPEIRNPKHGSFSVSIGRGRRAILVCDEFAAVLDRVSAAVVARTLRRAITPASSASAIVATSHEDLAGALQPDAVVTCDFGITSVETITHDE